MRVRASAWMASLSRQAGDPTRAVSQLRDAWSICRRRLGKPGIAALLLTWLTAGVVTLLIIPVKQGIADKEKRLHLLSRLKASPAAPSDPTAAAMVQQALLSERMFPDQLDRLMQYASDQGLQLNDGQYAVTLREQGQGEVVSYEVTLPLRGSYPQIRRFLAALLAREQGVALLDVQFRRAKVSDPVLEAVVRLAYFLRPST